LKRVDLMEDILVSSWDELTERLYEESWKEPLGRFRSSFAFRGMSEASHDLRTSLSRLAEAGERLEGHLLRNFRKYARRDAVPDDSMWNWLALAQHHGLPTRLLDWTYSPYVAMHFATVNLEKYTVDGVIWCVDFVKSNELLPKKLKAILKEEGSNALTVDMLNRVGATLADFDRLWKEDFVVFFEPPSLDDRIVNQFALFSMMSDPTARLDFWLAAHPALYRRLVIPAQLKWEVRDKLDQANITERVLFPGLDGLSSWLKRYYTPKSR
jgi:FRG domain-containing protein